jgi:ABC-type phosphate transport system substrate-binding protein
MSAFTQKTRKLGIRAGLLAGASAAILAISGIGAGAASAATPACPEAASVSAEGSSLQKTAQGLWTGMYTTTCSTKPASVSYTSTSSLTALEGWGAFNGTTQAHTHQLIASDEAPESEEIAKMIAAAEAHGGSGAALQIVPVTQAAIAIIVHPPSGCTISQIKQDQLEKVFRGTITKWSEITTSSGCGSATITRIVRADGSGTTFQFKHLLAVNGPTATCAGTWEALQSTTNNTKWPKNGVGTCAGLSNLETPALGGGGEEAAKVKSTVGSIGYVDEATAHANLEAGKLATLEVSNNAAESEYAAPASGTEANCAHASYIVPEKAQEPVENENVAGWSEVYGSGQVTPNAYPICTLTWDIAFRDYSNGGFGSAFGKTVEDYLRNEVLEDGQAELTTNFYSPLPSTGTPSTDVLAAARAAASQITN